MVCVEYFTRDTYIAALDAEVRTFVAFVVSAIEVLCFIELFTNFEFLWCYFVWCECWYVHISSCYKIDVVAVRPVHLISYRIFDKIKDIFSIFYIIFIRPPPIFYIIYNYIVYIFFIKIFVI